MRAQLKETLTDIRVLAITVFRRFMEDNCFRVASSLSFTTLLALVPLATVTFSMLSLFPFFERWTGQIESFLFENFVPAAGETVKSYLLDFASKAGRLTAVGLIFLLVSSLLLLSTIEDAFNDIWRVDEGRPWFQRLLIYWAVLTLGPLLIVISLSMTSALFSFSFFTDGTVIPGATQYALKYLPFLLELGAFMLFYQAIPNLEIRFRDAFIGAAVATVLFELSKYGFGIYILNFNSYELIYGALATIPIFLLWIYLCWLVLLIGALVVAVLGEREGKN